MPERTLPAHHRCTWVEFIGLHGFWRCACGRAWRPAKGAFERFPEWDDHPLSFDRQSADD